MLCSTLQEVRTPPALLYIAHRAFLECKQLTQLIKLEEKSTWRGPYVECNTFDLCEKCCMPTWLNLLIPDGEESQASLTPIFNDELRKNLH